MRECYHFVNERIVCNKYVHDIQVVRVCSKPSKSYAGIIIQAVLDDQPSEPDPESLALVLVQRLYEMLFKLIGPLLMESLSLGSSRLLIDVVVIIVEMTNCVISTCRCCNITKDFYNTLCCGI
jgi:hypothetical protein